MALLVKSRCNRRNFWCELRNIGCILLWHIYSNVRSVSLYYTFTKPYHSHIGLIWYYSTI